MLQQEFEQLTDTKVSKEQFEVINQMYMYAGDMDKETFCKAYMKGDFISIVPLIIEDVKREAQHENLQEIDDLATDYEKKLNLFKQKAENLQERLDDANRVLVEKDEQIQENFEVLKKTIKEYMNLGQYEQISAFKTLFVFSGKGEKDWVEFLCSVAKSNN